MNLRAITLRNRLLLWHGLLSALLITGFGFSIFHLESTRRYAEIDAQLTSRLGMLVDALRQDRRPDRESPIVSSEPLQKLTKSEFSVTAPYYFAVWLRGQTPVLRSPSCPEGVQRPANSSSTVFTRDDFREIHLAAAPVDAILVGTSVKSLHAELATLSGKIVLIGLFLQGLSIIPGIWLSKRTAAPIESIIRTARQIASGNLRERITIDSEHGELSGLAENLNLSFAQLEELFQQQNRFTSDAAHELRTPVAVILSQTQSILRRERSPAEYREAITAIARGAERMKALTATLLRLAKIDSHREKPNKLRVNLEKALQPHIQRLHDESSAASVQVSATLTSTDVRADAAHLDVILSNLLNNALQHNMEGGSIQISTERHSSQSSLQITNTSAHIPSDVVPQLFDRFVQADPSRKGDHAGLGLSLARELTQLNGGTLSLDHKMGLTTVCLTLPNADANSHPETPR